MDSHKKAKNNTNHKFPKLQREVDSILETFDSIELSIDGEVYDEKMEINHMDVDDVIAGRSEKHTPRTRHSIVEKARKDQKKQDLKTEEDRIHSISVKRINAEYAHPNGIHIPQKSRERLFKTLTSVFKHLKF